MGAFAHPYHRNHQDQEQRHESDSQYEHQHHQHHDFDSHYEHQDQEHYDNYKYEEESSDEEGMNHEHGYYGAREEDEKYNDEDCYHQWNQENMGEKEAKGSKGYFYDGMKGEMPVGENVEDYDVSGYEHEFGEENDANKLFGGEHGFDYQLYEPQEFFQHYGHPVQYPIYPVGAPEHGFDEFYPNHEDFQHYEYPQGFQDGDFGFPYEGFPHDSIYGEHCQHQPGLFVEPCGSGSALNAMPPSPTRPPPPLPQP